MGPLLPHLGEVIFLKDSFREPFPQICSSSISGYKFKILTYFPLSPARGDGAGVNTTTSSSFGPRGATGHGQFFIVKKHSSLLTNTVYPKLPKSIRKPVLHYIVYFILCNTSRFAYIKSIWRFFICSQY
jgi:hypothetical protein